MLKNEKQYNSARAQLQKWLQAREVLAARMASNAAPAWLLDEEKFGIEQQIERLKKDLQDYNDLATGKKQLPSATFIVAQIPDLLVSHRIAKHWTQKDLAERVGMPENQIQRYESQNYASVSLSVINRIATALQLEESEDRHPASA